MHADTWTHSFSFVLDIASLWLELFVSNDSRQLDSAETLVVFQFPFPPESYNRWEDQAQYLLDCGITLITCI